MFALFLFFFCQVSSGFLSFFLSFCSEPIEWIEGGKEREETLEQTLIQVLVVSLRSSCSSRWLDVTVDSSISKLALGHENEFHPESSIPFFVHSMRSNWFCLPILSLCSDHSSRVCGCYRFWVRSFLVRSLAWVWCREKGWTVVHCQRDMHPFRSDQSVGCDLCEDIGQI